MHRTKACDKIIKFVSDGQPKVEWDSLRPPSEAQRMEGRVSELGSVFAEAEVGDNRRENSETPCWLLSSSQQPQSNDNNRDGNKSPGNGNNNNKNNNNSNNNNTIAGLAI